MKDTRVAGVGVVVVALALAACTASSSSALIAPSCSAAKTPPNAAPRADCADGPANTTGPVGRAETDREALRSYLNAVVRNDCVTAERFALRSAFVDGDFCAGPDVGPLSIDEWRNPKAIPTPAGETAYAVGVHVVRTQDGTPDGWRTRFVFLRQVGAYFYVASVATGP